MLGQLGFFWEFGWCWWFWRWGEKIGDGGIGEEEEKSEYNSLLCVLC